MRKLTILIFAVFFLLSSVQSNACVGRILNIGIMDTLNENLLAELVSVLINERTGTTVNVKVFDDREEIRQHGHDYAHREIGRWSWYARDLYESVDTERYEGRTEAHRRWRGEDGVAI